MNDLSTYLINLDGSDDRLKTAAMQLNHTGLQFQRVAAFDGRNLEIERFPDYDHDRAMQSMGRPLRGGEIGCYISHLDCARRIVASEASWGLVLEDDFQFTAGFAAGLAALKALLGKEAKFWDLVHLSPNRHRIYTGKASFDAGGQHHVLTHAHYFPMTTTALLWSREGARAFVEGHQAIWAPVDNYFRHWQTRRDRGLAVWPPLVTTSGAESEIAGDGAARRSVEGRLPHYGWIKQKRLMTDKVIALRHKWRARKDRR